MRYLVIYLVSIVDKGSRCVLLHSWAVLNVFDTVLPVVLEAMSVFGYY